MPCRGWGWDRVAELLAVDNVVKHFPVVRGAVLARQVGAVHALDDVSFTLEAGRTLALVGESGSGKTTAAKIVLRLLEPTSGTVRYDGVDIATLDHAAMRRLRSGMQIVFQDPYESLNPRMRIGDIVAEPLTINDVLPTKAEARRRACELLGLVGLEPAMTSRYPHQLSSGQRQRVGVARALGLGPRLLVCDEPVSALDVSIQAQILELLARLQRELDLAYLFISHDLAVVRQIAERVAVMYLGKIVEEGAVGPVYEAPHHPYTQALLSAVPIPDPETERKRRRIILRGEVPSGMEPPSGCRFRTRCPIAAQVCAEEEPPLVSVGEERRAACHFAKANPVPV